MENVEQTGVTLCFAMSVVPSNAKLVAEVAGVVEVAGSNIVAEVVEQKTHESETSPANTIPRGPTVLLESTASSSTGASRNRHKTARTFSTPARANLAPNASSFIGEAKGHKDPRKIFPIVRHSRSGNVIG